jgi:hypothetical protein
MEQPFRRQLSYLQMLAPRKFRNFRNQAVRQLTRNPLKFFALSFAHYFVSAVTRSGDTTNREREE